MLNRLSTAAVEGLSNTSGTSTDIIYPVSKLVNGQFQSGRTLEFNWKSDKHRFWLPRSTRLVVHYEAKFGEVDSTASTVTEGPADSTGAARHSLRVSGGGVSGGETCGVSGFAPAKCAK